MCGRFEVKTASKKLKERFKLKLAPPAAAMGEQFPTNRILTIDAEQGLSRGRLLGWGISVDWTDKPLINARAETLTQKATFRPLLNRRCLIPATAYYEWQKGEDGKKHKMRLHPTDQEIFAMAGLVGADGDSVTIVTCAPSPEIADIHDRMPVILRPDLEAAWIDPKTPFEKVRDARKPYDENGGMASEDAG